MAFSGYDDKNGQGKLEYLSVEVLLLSTRKTKPKIRY